MSTNLRAPGAQPTEVDGRGRSVAIVCSRFNDAIVTGLERGARRALVERGVDDRAIDTVWVPGALEIPQVAARLAAARRHDAVVALGAVIKGDTYHFEVVCNASAAGLMQLSLTSDVVITNGVVTAYDDEQALVRSVDDDRNKGAEAAIAALQTLVAIDGFGS